ncbi:MAG: thiol-disulfide isomerase/thioredoxin [Bradymonadia bacterium]|jgi:thiol-disulfide isomerase/thioredoxin
MLDLIRPIQTLLLSASLALAFGACDPGEVCEPREGLDLPEGVDPCDPTTYPAANADLGTQDLGAPGDALDDAETDASSGDYPTGPFGTGVGALIAPLEFPTVDPGIFSFDSEVFQNEDVRLVLVSTAAGWCTACREEQPALVELYNEHKDDGLLVILAIFEDNNSSVVTPEFAQGWVNQYGIPFPALIDEFNDFASFYEPTLAPMNMFLDGETMEIINITIGAIDESTANAIIADRL